MVRVADGDCAGLGNAVAALTNSASNSTILLARKGAYSRCTLYVKGGSAEIDAQGATLTLFSANVTASAVLTVRNATLIGGASGEKLKSACQGWDKTPAEGEADVICNNGSLTLENVTFKGWSFPLLCERTDGIGGGCSTVDLISSSGSLVLRNVVFADSSMDSAPFITNAGTLEIYNSTIANATGIGPRIFTYTASAPGSPSATMKIANSLFAGSSRLCAVASAVSSFGGNVGTDSSCGFSANGGDKVVSDLALPAAGAHGGLVPTVQIGFGNPAYRAGVAQYCAATDARGVTRNTTNCDAGAYESGGGLGLVTSNGMNGLYYVPGIANGHYVSVQRIHDNKDVLVFWDTFDRNGNQAWIFGVGTLTSDRHIHASMARTLGGVLQQGGPPTGAKASDWGTVDIDLTNCSAAQFSYQSDLPEFGSGQFPLTRLAFESAVNCGD